MIVFSESCKKKLRLFSFFFTEFVGEECSKLNISASCLKAGSFIEVPREKITEAVIIEIDAFRHYAKEPVATTGKWMRLLLGERCGQKSDRGLAKRAGEMRKKYNALYKYKKGSAEVTNYTQSVFTFANEREGRPQSTTTDALHKANSTNVELKRRNTLLKKLLMSKKKP